LGKKMMRQFDQYTTRKKKINMVSHANRWQCSALDRHLFRHCQQVDGGGVGRDGMSSIGQ
jgi:hypothetical protein